MLVLNKEGTAGTVVDQSNTAKTMGSGSLEVYATPALCDLMEKAACNCIEGCLEEGKTTIGTKLDISHLAATPIGMTVTCTARLIEIDNRRLLFEVTASDGVDTIGKGTHERFIVDAVKFMGKASSKL